jgi:hypothetical protein
MESQLEEIGRLLREDEKLNKELRTIGRKVDTYYNRKDEINYNALLDESVKTIVVEEPLKDPKKQQNIKIDAVLKYLPSIF